MLHETKWIMEAGSIFEEWKNPQGELQEIKQCFLRTPLQSLLLRKIAQNEEKLFRSQISKIRNPT